MRKCQVCKEYTMKEEHCGKPTVTAHPMKFSIEKDKKYGKYRTAKV